MYYNNEYYSKLIENNNYDYIKKFLTISDYMAKGKWLCSSNLSSFENAYNSKSKSLITLGLGINGVPHLGTLSQILKIIYLQRMGFEVQIILGDLDVYGARGQDLNNVKDLVKRYKEFIQNIGFDTKKGIIRNQFDHDEVLKTAYLISSVLKDSDFLDCKEDIYDLYKELNLYPGMEYNVKQSILLMFADFIHPGLSKEYENILVMCGVDEHVYPKKAMEIVDRMGLNFSLSGLYSKILPGLNGNPKMSKSLKDSGILLTDDEKKINNIIVNGEDDYNTSSESIIFQMIMNASLYDENTIKQIENECNNKTNEWKKIKKMYANDLYNMTRKWR